MQSFNINEKQFPHFQFINTTTNTIICQTVDNQIRNIPLDISITRSIFRKKFDYINLQSGTYTNEYYLTPNIYIHEDNVTPIIKNEYLQCNLLELKFENEKFSFRVQSPEFYKQKQTYISFQFDQHYYKFPPIKVKVQNFGINQISVQNFGGVPIGGFVGPISIYISNSSYNPLEISLLSFNTSQSIIKIIPQQLKYTNGQRIQQFYLLSHYSSRASFGYFILLKSGEEQNLFSFLNQENKINFKIFEGKNIQPQLLYFSYIFENRQQRPEQEIIIDDQQLLTDQISITKFPEEETIDIKISLQYDSQVIIHYALYPRYTIDVSFEEIFNKKLKYDDFQTWIHFGSKLMEQNTQNMMEFILENVSIGYDCVLKIFAVNKEGQISKAYIKYLSTYIIEDSFSIFVLLKSEISKDQLIQDLQNQLNIQGLTTQYDFNSSIYEEKIIIDNIPFKIQEDMTLIPEEILEKEKNENQKQQQTDILKFEINTQNDQLNQQKRINKEIEDNINMGYDIQTYTNIQSNFESNQQKKIEIYKENYEYLQQNKQYIVKQNDYEYQDNIFVLQFPPEKKFIRLFNTIINNENQFLKQQINNSKLNLIQNFPYIEDIYTYYLKRKPIKWSSLNKPLIKNINENSVIIENFISNEDSNLLFTVQEVIRTEYKNKFQPGKNHFLIQKDFENYERKCLQNSNNIYEVKCYPENNVFIEKIKQERIQSDIYNFTKLYHLPSNLNIKRGLDPNNFQTIQSGQKQIKKDNPFTLKIENLPSDKHLVIFITLQINDIKERFLQEDDIIALTMKTHKKEISYEEIKRIFFIIFIIIIQLWNQIMIQKHNLQF